MNKSLSIINKKNNRNNILRHLTTNIFINIVIKQLRQIRIGYLELNFNDKAYYFGDSSSTKKVILNIQDPIFFQIVVLKGHLGFAEAFGKGYCTGKQLTEILELFARNFAVVDKAENGLAWAFNKIQYLYYRYFEQNTRLGSRKNIQTHYDLDNSLFSLFLDSNMQYSSALFKTDDLTLEDAQYLKMEAICHRLNIKKDEHILELGSGWGGLAIHIAKHIGCQITTITISQEQFNYAQQRIKDENLTDKITLKLCDYRDITGYYDKIVSIEMIEAVGDKYYQSYFDTCKSLLKPGGLFLMQAILISDHEYIKAKNSVDFIKRYIFPGSNIPSLNRLNDCANRAQFCLENYFDMTTDYVKTLAIWQKRFNNHSNQLSMMGYDNYFQNIWNFYFSYCQAGFIVEHIRDAHLIFRKIFAKKHS